MITIDIIPHRKRLAVRHFGDLLPGDVAWHYGMYLLCLTKSGHPCDNEKGMFSDNKVVCVRLTGRNDGINDDYPQFSVGRWDPMHKIDGYILKPDEATLMIQERAT